MKNIYTIKRTVSKAQESFGMLRFTLEGVQINKKIVEMGYGYDMIGALVLKFLKVTYPQFENTWNATNPMTGYCEIFKVAKSVGVDCNLVYSTSGKLVGLQVG